jgi:hypothetical protein
MTLNSLAVNLFILGNLWQLFYGIFGQMALRGWI